MLTKSWRNWFLHPPLLVPKNDFSKIKNSKKIQYPEHSAHVLTTPITCLDSTCSSLYYRLFFYAEIKLQKNFFILKNFNFFIIANSFMTNWCDIFVVFASDGNWFGLNFRIFRQIKCRTKLLIFAAQCPEAL